MPPVMLVPGPAPACLLGALCGVRPKRALCDSVLTSLESSAFDLGAALSREDDERRVAGSAESEEKVPWTDLSVILTVVECSRLDG